MNRVVFGIAIVISFYSCKNNTNSKNKEPVKDTLGIIDISAKIRKNPMNAELFDKRAAIYWSAGKKDSALNDEIIALRLDSMNDNFACHLAQFYFELIKTKEATELLDNFLKRKPESLEALTKQGKFFTILKDFKKAKEYINKALIIDPQYADAHFQKGMVLTETEQPKEAIKAFKEVIQYDPENTEAYMMLGLLYQELNDSIALEYYRAVTRLLPKDPQAYYNIAFFYQENKNYPKAFENYNYILRNIDKKYIHAFFNQGYIYLMYLKDYAKAISYFDSALVLEPNRAEAIYNKGLCYEMMKDYSSARSLYIKAKSLVPNYQLAIDGLNRLDKVLK